MPARCGGGPDREPSTVSTPDDDEEGGYLLRRVGSDCVEIGEEQAPLGAVRGDVGGDRARLTRRDDREHHLRLVQERRERAHVLEARIRRERSRPLAATLERDDDASATVPEAGAERAPHLPCADQPDDRPVALHRAIFARGNDPAWEP